MTGSVVVGGGVGEAAAAVRAGGRRRPKAPSLARPTPASVPAPAWAVQAVATALDLSRRFDHEREIEEIEAAASHFEDLADEPNLEFVRVVDEGQIAKLVSQAQGIGPCGPEDIDTVEQGREAVRKMLADVAELAEAIQALGPGKKSDLLVIRSGELDSATGRLKILTEALKANVVQARDHAATEAGHLGDRLPAAARPDFHAGIPPTAGSLGAA